MNKKILIMLTVGIISIFASTLLFYAVTPEEYQYMIIDEHNNISSWGDNVATVLYGDKSLSVEGMEGDYLYTIENSSNSSVMIATYKDDGLSVHFSAKGSEPVLLGKNIDSSGFRNADCLRISDDGSTAVFCDYNCLCVYRNGKKEKIAELENPAGVAVSPDGKTVVFADAKDNETYKCYIYSKGIIKPVDGSFCPIAVSDDASVIYGKQVDENGYAKLFVVENLGKAKNLGQLRYWEHYYTTDRKQLIYPGEELSYYIYNPGIGEAVKLCEGELYVFTPSGNYADEEIDHNISDFDDFYVRNKGKTLRITRNGSEYDITEPDDNDLPQYTWRLITADDDNNIENSKLYISGNSDKTEISDDMFYYCGRSGDFKKIYYVNTDNELMCYINGESIKLDSNIHFGCTGVTDNGICVYISNYDYYSKSGELYSTDGKNIVHIMGFKGTVNEIHTYGKSVVFKSDKKLYASNDGKNFKEIK